MSNLRDFGEIVNDYYGGSVPGPLSYVDTLRYTQVYTATHEGSNYLPFMNRSFISFSFGTLRDAEGIEHPVCIEDFNLIATTSNDRLERTGSSEFEDLVNDYNIIDGSFYWGTHYKSNKFTFRLATDGMSLLELDRFKYWFAGGKTRELILAEHPNRAILARVSAPPKITLLPFESPTTVMVNGKAFKTSTTLYKGEIELEFTMDEPFWYAKINIFGYYDTVEGEYRDEWRDANGRMAYVYGANENIDIMKIVLEDNIPTSNMIKANMLLGNNVFASMDNDGAAGHIAKNSILTKFYRYPIWDVSTEYSVGDIVYSDVVEANWYECAQANTGMLPSSTSAYWTLLNNYTADAAEVDICDLIAGEPGELTIYILGDQLQDIENPDHKSHIQNILLSHGLTFSHDEEEEEETMIDWAHKVLNVIGNSLSFSDTWVDTDPHATIWNPEFSVGARIVGPHMAPDTGVESLGSEVRTSFYYAGTAPSYPVLEFNLTPIIDMNGYICSPCNSYATTRYDTEGQPIPYNSITIESLTSREFKFTTPNIYTAYNEAIKIFKSLSTRGGEAWEKIRSLIRDNVKHYAVRAWANRIIDYQVKINGGTIVAYNESEILALMRQFLLRNNSDLLMPASYSFDSKNGKSMGIFTVREYAEDPNTNNPLPYQMITIEEDVSDMLKSNYLVITDRNHPNERGEIVTRVAGSDYEKTYSYSLYHNVLDGIKNLFIKYKNMYL